MSEALVRREAGILVHPTSLPGPGIGDLGAGAHHFLDWLWDAGQSVWQILPLTATAGAPYNGLSAMAGDTRLIEPLGLVADRLLSEEAIRDPGLPAGWLDFAGVAEWKEALLRRAFANYRAGAGPHLREEFDEYRQEHAFWLDDWALFAALREANGRRPWLKWPVEVRLRDPAALASARRALAEEVELHAFAQFLFDRQWEVVRTHANLFGIRILGDVPIFVAHDSADVWAHPEWFTLDENGHSTAVSGVPPDYFSATGQRWGNPLYRWDVMERDGYRWWTERFRRTLEWVDLARIDHFRGFESYWEIPAEEPTALHGRWMPGPGTRLFRAVERKLGPLPLVAEDLGIITREVEELREELDLPGMRVLQFAFGEDDPENPHLPANYPASSVAYTGTHDNDTSLGWYREGATDEERRRLRALTDAPPEEMHWGMIEVVLRSPAHLAVVPLQDVLGLGSEARMNTPGTVGDDNWSWRIREGDLTPALARRLRRATEEAGRV